VDEWRNGVLIGSINYDFELVVADYNPQVFPFIRCSGKTNDTGISITLPENTYIYYKEDYTQNGFIISNADSFTVSNELIEAGKTSLQSETTETENGLQHVFTLDISNLAIEDTKKGFYIFNITGYKDDKSYSEQWLLKIDNVASISEKLFAENFILYPNPASSQVIIEANKIIENPKVTIFNSIGKLITTNLFSTNTSLYKIDVSRLPNGFYFIYLQTHEGGASWKFLKY
jgi:hypothetical protein